MNELHNLQRNFGEQPIAKLMQENGLTAHDLVSASSTQLTFKLVQKACKGRKLTPHSRNKLINVMQKVLDRPVKKSDLFTY